MLPALAFNNARSSICTEVLSVAEKAAAILPKVNAYEARNEDGAFQQKLSSIDLNGLRLIAYAHTEVYFERDDCKGLDLLIPLEGSNYTETGGVRYDFVANETAFLASCERRHTFVNKSGVIVRLDAKRITDTCSSMMGRDRNERVEFTTRTPSLRHEDIDFSSLFKSVFAHIDAVGGRPETLSKLALDDSIVSFRRGPPSFKRRGLG